MALDVGDGRHILGVHKGLSLPTHVEHIALHVLQKATLVLNLSEILVDVVAVASPSCRC